MHSTSQFGKTNSEQMCAFACGWKEGSVNLWMHVCMAWMAGCLHASMPLCLHVSMSACPCVCVHACMYVVAMVVAMAVETVVVIEGSLEVKLPTI